MATTTRDHVALLTINSTEEFLAQVRGLASALGVKHADLVRDAATRRLEKGGKLRHVAEGVGRVGHHLRVEVSHELKAKIAESAAREGQSMSRWLEAAIFSQLTWLCKCEIDYAQARAEFFDEKAVELYRTTSLARDRAQPQ